MAIENAIAQFGMNAGQNIQNTVGNALLRAREQKRYDQQQNILAAQRQAEQQQLQDQAEREYATQGVSAILSMPQEQWGQGYAGFYQGAKQRGFDVAGMPTPDQFTPDAVYSLAAAAGAKMPDQKQSNVFGKVKPEQFTPESLKAFTQSGDYSQLELRPNAGKAAQSKPFQPVQYTDESGQVRYGIPNYDPNTGQATMSDLQGVTPITPEKPISPTVQKILDDAQQQYFESDRRSRSFDVLASDIEKAAAQFGGGLKSTWTEAVKQATGNQDAISELRRNFNAVRASQAVTNLPAGAASDKDIALALSGFPPENAPAGQVVSFLRGMSKLEGLKAEFNQYRSQLISTQGSTKDLIKGWKKYATTSGLYDRAGSGDKSQLSDEDQQALDWANSNPGDPRAKAIKDKLGQ